MVADCLRASWITVVLMNTFSQYLLSENIFLGLRAANKLQAFALIAERLERNCQINRALVYQKLYERENMDSTGLGDGVAIPHAQVAGISQPIAAFVRLHAPLDFAAPDGQPVSELFVLLLPLRTTRDHLQILADLAGKLCDPQFRTRLEHAVEVPAILQCLQKQTLAS